jgi:hypothetical protein
MKPEESDGGLKAKESTSNTEARPEVYAIQRGESGWRSFGGICWAPLPRRPWRSMARLTKVPSIRRDLDALILALAKGPHDRDHSEIRLPELSFEHRECHLPLERFACLRYWPTRCPTR